mgnify:CR=1 FL=1
MYTIRDIYNDKAKIQKHNNLDKLNKLLNSHNMNSEYDIVGKVFVVNHNLDNVTSTISLCINKWLKGVNTKSPLNMLYNILPVSDNTLLLKV